MSYRFVMEDSQLLSATQKFPIATVTSSEIVADSVVVVLLTWSSSDISRCSMALWTSFLDVCVGVYVPSSCVVVPVIVYD